MAAPQRFATAISLLLGLAVAVASALAQDHSQDRVQERVQERTQATRPAVAHLCLDQKERRAEAASGAVVHLAAAIQAAKTRMAGTVVRARLCHSQDGLVYVLTVLGRDGKVARMVVDASKGTLVGER
jgi:uncharacterized membrane protein YkoI